MFSVEERIKMLEKEIKLLDEARDRKFQELKKLEAMVRKND